MEGKCLICGSNCCEYSIENGWEFDCQYCGKYKYHDAWAKSAITIKQKNRLASYLFYNSDKINGKFHLFLDKIRDGYVGYCISINMVENWMPKTFDEKINLILQELYKRQESLGEKILIEEHDASRMFFVETGRPLKKYDQINYIEKYLSEEGLAKVTNDDEHGYVLTPKALGIIYELQKYTTTSKDIFVAMAFNEGTTGIREAIRNGISSSGHNAVLIDEVLHGKQIVPEMFRLIKESKMLVMDVTDPNYGAYLEAGYAMGLGKNVIISCKHSVFDGKDMYVDCEIQDGNRCKFKEKYLKPHFDITQRQLLIWDDEEDLSIKLSKWIAAFG